MPLFEDILPKSHPHPHTERCSIVNKIIISFYHQFIILLSNHAAVLPSCNSSNKIYFPSSYINTSTKVTWHIFDNDLVRQYYWAWGDIVSPFKKFLSLSSDTAHNAKVMILTNTDPIVWHKVLNSKLQFGYMIQCGAVCNSLLTNPLINITLHAALYNAM